MNVRIFLYFLCTVILYYCTVTPCMGKKTLYNIKIGMMLPKEVMKDQIGFGTSAGAVTIALKRIEKEEILPGANISFEWIFTECDEMKAMHASVDLFVLYDVDVIIGPACSIEAVVTGIMGGAYNKVLVTWAATASELIVEERFPTLISPIGTADSLNRGLHELIEFFQWQRIAVLYNDDTKAERKCHYVVDGLLKRLQAVDTEVRIYLTKKAADRIVSDEEIDEFLQELPKVARIAIVCLDSVEDRRRFMLRVYDKGLDTDEYVYILPDYLPDYNRSKIWIDYSQNPDGRDKDVKKALERAFIVEFKTLHDEELDDFKKEVPKIMKEWPFYYTSSSDEKYGSTFSPFLHDAMYLYALCLNKTLDDGKEKNDGRAVFDKARNTKFIGMTGQVHIDSWSIRMPDFVVKGYDNSHTYKDLASIHMEHEDGRTVTLEVAEWRIWANRNDGKRPLDHPKCGWFGELCVQDTSNIAYIVVAAAAVLAVLVCFAVVAALFMKNRKGALDAQNSIWQISPGELTKLVRGMREFNHENVNPFFGLVIEGLTVRSVWKFCAKGSLQDVFEKESVKLDWFFKYSLIRDLTSGLEFLHNSILGYHGRLTSYNCLVDNRWVLKIDDYGLRSLRNVTTDSKQESTTLSGP